jgi:hypothetical protein
MSYCRQIICNGIQFNSKKAFTDYVRCFIKNIGVCSSVSNKGTTEFQHLNNILKRHPEYHMKTSNMKDYKVITNYINRNALAVMIINNDDTETDISWHTAINGKPNTVESELKSAMRYSIEYQIQMFRNSQTQCVCNYCNISNVLMHVDHVEQFQSLYDTFIKSVELKTPNSFLDSKDGTHRRQFTPDDNEFETKWQNFHLNNATLQILCARCNLTRKKK